MKIDFHADHHHPLYMNRAYFKLPYMLVVIWKIDFSCLPRFFGLMTVLLGNRYKILFAICQNIFSMSLINSEKKTGRFHALKKKFYPADLDC